MYYSFLVSLPDRMYCDKCRGVKHGTFFSDIDSGRADGIWCQDCLEPEAINGEIRTFGFCIADEDFISCGNCEEVIHPSSPNPKYVNGKFYHESCIESPTAHDVDDGYEID